MQERCVFMVWISLAIIAFSSADQEVLFDLMTGSWDNNSTLSGVRDALDEINRRNDLLSGYKLSYINSQVIYFITHLYKTPVILIAISD